ncbi:MAG: DUF3617 domain-containing protein [Caulobacteraceae bacterium]
MHRSIRLAGLAGLAVLLCGCHKARAPAEASAPIPAAATAQSPGLWVQRVSDRHGVATLRYCLDASAAAGLAAFDQKLGARCERHDMAQAADGSWRFSTRCDMGAGGKVSTEGAMHGDFAHHYVVEAESQTVGAANPAADGPDRVLADVRRVGDCPAGMKGGDAILPNGAHEKLSTLGASA